MHGEENGRIIVSCGHCRTACEVEDEVKRLKDDLDRVLGEARRRFAGKR